ncbi:hypothetical protein [Listeria floridensis]|uniref:hypothetical protein n=1 Tax=Listeria floridensis TaxID=1494962 RepID=UPI0011EA4CFF|nr:hypothetical protein [Listeria floridensis]
MPGGEVIGKQFIMDSNPRVKFGTAPLAGHMTDTFAGMFNADGSAQLKVNPEAIIKRARKIDTIVAIMQDIQKRMEDLEDEVNQESRALRNNLNADTAEGARFSELTIWDVDEILTERAKKYHNGVYTFHDPEKFQAFYQSNESNIKQLKAFQTELMHAAKKNPRAR